MRRAATALGAAALIALILTPAPGSASRGDAGASAGCSPKRHTKRVVKHVRRHGKLRRVVRVRHWWTCRQPAAPPELGAATPQIPGPGPQSPAEPVPTLGHLSVKSKEYDYTLSRPSVTAGEVVVELNNQGEDPHNLNLQLANGQGPEYSLPETGSQKRELERFTLPAGSYRLWCSIPGHEELGMKATFSVVAP